MTKRYRYILRQGLTAVMASAVGALLAATPMSAQDSAERRAHCLRLEQQLANEWVRGRKSGNELPAIDRKIRKQDDIYQKYRYQAERDDCYEDFFIFGRSLRRTRKCLQLDRKIRQAKDALASLKRQRESLSRANSGGGTRQRLINALADAGCGRNYERMARRERPQSGFSWFGDDNPFFGNPEPRRRYVEPDPGGIQPFATYRTMCVRLCDGYYFPVSFSTLPSHFDKDATVCSNTCAAPAQLYVYRNPGGEIEQMVSLDGRAYSALPNAWRHRKEYVKGCSCKIDEYTLNQPTPQNQGSDPGRRSDIGPDGDRHAAIDQKY